MELNLNLNLFKNSKIVIHIFSYDDIKIFDFYRFTLLLSNKIFFITDEQRQTIADDNYEWYKNVLNFDVEFKNYVDKILYQK